jgi:hypothetical protein
MTSEKDTEISMDTQITVVYCLCEDLLRALHHPEDPQCEMSDAEVLTTAIVAALYFGCNFVNARKLLREQRYIPHMLGASRFNRRLHRIKDLLLTLFACLGEHWKALNSESTYSLDSFPIAACDNIRIPRAKLYQGEAYRGYIASKKRYFYGVRIHMLVTQAGQPVEFFLLPGAWSDDHGLHYFNFDLPEGSTIYGDKAYNDYDEEDDLQETAEIALHPLRKKNSKRPFPPWVRYLQHCRRKIVETTGSLIENLLPKHIHAVTQTGFELKVVLLVLATSINCL